MAVDEGAGVPARYGVERYRRVLDLKGASRGGLEGEDTASRQSCNISEKKSPSKGTREKPLDDVECAERTVLWGEILEWGVERDADVVHFLS